MKIIYMRGTKHTSEVKVSNADYKDVNKYRWHIQGKYAVSFINGKNVLMHRFIMKPSEKNIVDHINNDELDNRRENLRVCDGFTNMQNRRKGRGYVQKLSLHNGKYIYYYGEVKQNKKRFTTTTCSTPEEAEGALKQLLTTLDLKRHKKSLT